MVNTQDNNQQNAPKEEEGSQKLTRNGLRELVEESFQHLREGDARLRIVQGQDHEAALLVVDALGEELEQAQEGNILSRTTLSLFYATDFADQLENIILPALKAGFCFIAFYHTISPR